MLHGIDPEFSKQLHYIREMVRLSHQSPTREWPLMYVEELEAVLVVREWTGGHLTAYTIVKNSSETHERGER